MYEVICATYPNGEDKNPVYARLEYKGRIEWRTKRIAQKHARDYKAIHLMDSWVQKV
jgi:hypothetical protein